MKTTSLTDIFEGMNIPGSRELPFFQIKDIIYKHIENAAAEIRREVSKKIKEEQKILKFQVGKTYATSSICDHECIFSFKIISRTEKSVVISGSQCDNVRRKISLSYDETEEVFYPFGKYSMCCCIHASHLQKEEE